jgi:hypothetical protein
MFHYYKNNFVRHCSNINAGGDEILTFGYVKPRDQRFPNERPPDRPFQDHPGLGSYTHRVRSRAPSGRARAGLPLSLRARGLDRALGSQSTEARTRSLAPSQPPAPAKARAQEGTPH